MCMQIILQNQNKTVEIFPNATSFDAELWSGYISTDSGHEPTVALVLKRDMPGIPASAEQSTAFDKENFFEHFCGGVKIPARHECRRPHVDPVEAWKRDCRAREIRNILQIVLKHLPRADGICLRDIYLLLEMASNKMAELIDRDNDEGQNHILSHMKKTGVKMRF